MLIPSRKVAFTHIPRTGGRTVYTNIGMTYEEAELNKYCQHSTPEEDEACGTGGLLRFGTFREPASHLWSLYHYWKLNGSISDDTPESFVGGFDYRGWLGKYISPKVTYLPIEEIGYWWKPLRKRLLALGSAPIPEAPSFVGVTDNQEVTKGFAKLVEVRHGGSLQLWEKLTTQYKTNIVKA